MEKDVTLTLHLVEDETNTEATATLDLRGEHFESRGSARRNPTDPQVPVIGEELAIARALSELTAKVMEAAQQKVATLAVPD